MAPTQAERRERHAKWRRDMARRNAEADAAEAVLETRDEPTPVTVGQVLSESSREVWQRWRVDREIRAARRRINAELEAREAANLPIYPRECAQRLAEDLQTVAPDWRHARPTLGPAWGRLLKAQPELARDLTEQREQAVTAVFASVPKAMQRTVSELRTLIDLLLTA